MLVAAVSDLHGHFPDIPAGVDVLVIAGDMVAAGNQREEFKSLVEFGQWMAKLTLDRGIVCVGVSGNHDFLLRDNPDFRDSLPWAYLEDSGTEHMGVQFYGTPWQSWYGGWAYNAPEHDPGEEFLRQKFEAIPAETDVLITHSPPAGFFDRVGKQNIGSSALNRRVQQICPQLHVFGHCHQPGVETVEGVTLCNAAVTHVRHGRYVPTGKPVPVFRI